MFFASPEKFAFLDLLGFDSTTTYTYKKKNFSASFRFLPAPVSELCPENKYSFRNFFSGLGVPKILNIWSMLDLIMMYQPNFFQIFSCIFPHIFPRLKILNEENSVKMKSYHIFDSVEQLPQFIRNYPRLNFFQIHRSKG